MTAVEDRVALVRNGGYLGSGGRVAWYDRSDPADMLAAYQRATRQAAEYVAAAPASAVHWSLLPE